MTFPPSVARDIVFPEQRFSGNRATDLVCLFGMSILVALIGLWNGPGLGDHESIVALGARNIRQTGDWVVPRVTGEEFLRKPPLAFWTAALASYLAESPAGTAPVNEAAARLPSALAAVLTTMIVYILGCAMFEHSVAMISALVFACCTGTFFFSHNAQVEMQLTLFMTTAYASFWIATESHRTKSWWLLLFYASLGLAMLAKAPLPLALVVLPLAIWWLVVIPIFRLKGEANHTSPQSTRTRMAILVSQVRRIAGLVTPSGLVVFLIVFLPWPVYVAWKYPSTLDLWRIEYLARYSGDLSEMSRPIWYYLPIAFGMALPFSLTLPEALAAPFVGTYRKERKPLLFLLVMLVIPLLFLSTAAFKRPHYIAGCTPAMALLLGPALYRLFVVKRVIPRKMLVVAAAGILLSVVLAAVFGFDYLRNRFTSEADLLKPAGIVLIAGIGSAVVLFSTRQRLAGLVCLVATMPATYSLCWGALGQMDTLETRANHMIQELRAHGIMPTDKLIWLSGRPDARLTYYYGIATERLFTALELAPHRQGRTAVSSELVDASIDEIARLARDNPHLYFVVKGEYWENWVKEANLPVRLLFRVQSDKKETTSDWVVFSTTSSE